MAFDPYVRARALLSALGMMRQTRHVLTDDEIVARIRDRYDPDREQSFFTAFNLVRSARAIIDQGEAVQADPTRRIGARFTPRDPSILPQGQRYLYRVIVRADSPGGGYFTEMLVLIPSDRPLTGAEVLQTAFDAYRQANPPDLSPRARTAQMPDAPLTGFIISAGQRS